ncbi:amidohydrolase family protein [Gynurincola endophyticus]|uniref:amidohydrolase family protein n=1 Tax=Gynurincola endophyticus TaxID=2479004 RepID=UPI000F8C8F62|nr:amidohydrolase family protein [Gynurincola endophyticus]
MKISYTITTVLLAFVIFIASCRNQHPDFAKEGLLLRSVTLIDGSGDEPKRSVDILIKGDTISAIGTGLDTGTAANVIFLSGKTVMPALISAHVHVGNVKGTESNAEFYTRENIVNQLNRYADYGVLNVLSLGSDRSLLFEAGIRDSSVAGSLPGARLQSAGYGFGVLNGTPPVEFGMTSVLRPSTPQQVKPLMDSLITLHPSVIKIWVDDFGGKYKKMEPSIYKAIIDEAHKNNVRVASHAYYLSDARQLVNDGVDIIAHSIRDSIIDDALIQQMKSKGIIYIPTLTLDQYAYIYASKPDWADDAFFKASLEPGVYEMITSEKYQNDIKNSAVYAINEQAFKNAAQNLKKLFDAGVLIALGTDSGATPVRAQGFSEHFELELMVQAGLTPLEAITTATRNAAKALKIDHKYGTLEEGKIADFIIVDGDPSINIKDTRKINAVYKAGKTISPKPEKQ